MSTLYILALCGVCAVVFGAMFETIRNVSRKAVWTQHDSYVSVGPARAPLRAIEVLPVDARHSNFAGLTNEEEFELTA